MVLRQNRGTKKGIVIFDLSGCGFLGKKVRKSESRKRRFICDLSAFLEKGVNGCCVCEKKIVTLQTFCAVGDMVKTMPTIEETIKNNTRI